MFYIVLYACFDYKKKGVWQSEFQLKIPAPGPATTKECLNGLILASKNRRYAFRSSLYIAPRNMYHVTVGSVVGLLST